MPGLPTGWEVVKQGLPEGWAVVDEPEPEVPEPEVMERLLALSGQVGGQMQSAPAMSTAVAQPPPRGIVQRILDDEAREQAAAEGGPEPSIRAATPEEQIDTSKGIAPRDVARAQRTLEGYDPHTRLEKAYYSLKTGNANIIDLVGGGMIWAGFEESGKRVRQFAQSVIRDSEVKELYKEFELSDMADPDFYLTKGVQMIPSMLTLIPAAVGGGLLAGAAAGAAGLGEMGVTIAGAVASAMVSRPIESAMEAAGTYNSLLDQGVSPEQASEAASDVFIRNMALIGMDAGQFALAFAKAPAPLRIGMAGWIKRAGIKAVGFGAGSVSEGVEEVLQGYFQELGERAANGEVDVSILKSLTLASPGAKEAFVLGTIGGAVFQTAGGVKQILTPQETDAIIQEQIDNAPGEEVIPEKQTGQQEGVEYPVEYEGEEAPLKGTVEYPTEPAKPGEVVAEGKVAGEVSVTEPRQKAAGAEEIGEKAPEQPTTAITEEKATTTPVEAVPEVPGAAKLTDNPWEMTKEEFFKYKYGRTWTERIHVSISGRKSYNDLVRLHRAMIEGALSEGKPVPAEVLAEYLELGKEILAQPVRESVPDKGTIVPKEGTGGIAEKPTEAPEIERSKQVKPVSDLNLRPSVFIGSVALQGEFISDGHVVIKRSVLDEKRAKRLEEKPRIISGHDRGRYVEQAKIKELWQGYVREAKNEGELLGYTDELETLSKYFGQPDHKAYIVNKADETDIRIFDADKIRMLQSYVGFNKIKIPDAKLTPAVFYKDRKAVALLMPVRPEEGVVEVDVPTARRALAGEFVEEGLPKKDAPKVTWLHGQKPKGTATTADIGPDIFYEQELRQAFPEAEASPSEPLGPFAKDIEPRKDIGSDLMEAARIIAAPARYRKLRASMLGVFRRPDKIELQDIRWIRTLAHELGHAVDYRLTRHPRSVMKRFPDLGVNEMKARAELKRASEYFRPLPEGAKWDRGTSYMRYRAKHTELMADLTGLYMLSPKKAKELAPNVTEALESAIAGNGDVKTAIRAVLEPEQVEFIERQGRETMTELPPKPEFVGTEADPQIRKEAFDTVKLTSRELEAQLLRTFAFEKRLRKSLSEKERESLTFLIERIGDPRIEGDTFEKVQERATPEVRKMVREARYEQELNRQEANKIAQEAGDGPEWIQYIADYVPHFWVVPRKKALEYAGRWRKSTPHSKQRTFPTFADGVKLDWQPVSYDFAYLYSRAAENNFRAAITRRFARRIKDMRTTGGEPVMVGSLDKAGPDWVKIDHPVLRHVYARKTKDGKLILGEGNAYVHPSIARPVKVLLEKPFQGGFSKFIYAVNAAGKSINVAFSFFHEFSLFESSQAVNARFLNPLRGVFIGPFESRKLGLGFQPHLTHRAGFLLAEKDVYGFVDAAKHGLAIRRSPATIDYARTFLERNLRKIETGTRKVPALSFMTRKIRATYEGYQRHLWDNVHSGMKLFSYNTLVAETLPDLPADVSVRQTKETIASQVNDAFGGQEFLELPAKHAGKISWEPATVKQIQILHGLMFAPDWTFSNIRVAGRPIVNFRNRIMLLKGIRYWRNMILTLAGTAIILQKMLYEIFKGEDPDLKEWTWQNEPGREWDVDITPIRRKIQKTLGMEVQERRSYAHAGKQAREVLRYFSDFPKGLLQNIGNKSSVLVRLAVEQIAGHQAGSGFPMPWMDSGFQDEIEGWKRIMAQGKAAGEHFTPFSWQENNFAFSVPHRKGMSRYRASKHYKDAMMAFADPSWWDKIRGKVDKEAREKAAKDVMREVDEALKANGQDEDSRKGTFNSARSNLRGRYYGKFLKAVEDQDWKAADDYAVILWNLGAVYKTTKQSAERRGKKELWDEKARAVFTSRKDLRSRFLNYNIIMSK